MKRTVTYSELKARRRCPFKAHLSYDRRLTPMVKSPGLREGSIMDEGLNAHYSGQDMIAAMEEEYERQTEPMMGLLMDEEWALVDERFQLLLAVAREYRHFSAQADKGWNVITMQLEGRVPVLNKVGRASTRYDYVFKADGLVAIENELWLMENKAWKTIGSDAIRILPLDEQCSMYLWGINQLIGKGQASKEVMQAVADYGLPVGVLYNIIRKAVPKVPGLLKNGKTSTDKRVDTTHNVFLKTLTERGEDPSEYAEVLDALRAKGDTFHYREAVYRNAGELQEIGQRIHEGTRILAEGHTIKNPDRSCTWECAFFPLCVEWNEEVLSEHYYVREKRHEEYQELEAA